MWTDMAWDRHGMGQGLRSIAGMTLAAWGGEGVSPEPMALVCVQEESFTWEDTALTSILLYLQDHPGGGVLAWAARWAMPGSR